MKACPTCGRLYPADSGFCPVDGASLVRASQAPHPDSGSDERLGSVIRERYQLRRVVADGGMGRVYEALDLVDQRNVAVKILHGEVARDPVQVERFRREFAVSRELPHTHIVEVLDFLEAGAEHVLVMEFLYGEELSGTLTREGRIHPARAVRMLAQIALGLDEAHRRKFVHRDLKPDNVFLCQTPDGDIVKLLDFGSVKDKTSGAKKLTVMGTTIGSPYYMSPEQAQGLDTLDHRADIWSLAAILHEALAGSVPFGGSGPAQILMSILRKDAPRISAVTASGPAPMPASLDVVLERAFKKAASSRYESVGQLADAVGHAFGLSGGHAVWASTPERDLRSAIDARMPELLAVKRAVTPRTDVDRFFGDHDALGEVEMPPVSRDPMAEAMRAEVTARQVDAAVAERGRVERGKPPSPAPHQPEGDAFALPVRKSAFQPWMVLVALALVAALIVLLVLR